MDAPFVQRPQVPPAYCHPPATPAGFSPGLPPTPLLQVGNEILLTIAGNKLDLERQRVVSKQEAQEYAESVGATYHETSAKAGKGIDDTFSSMGKRLLEARAGAKRTGAGRSSGRTPMVLIDDDVPANGSGGKSSGCC